jgi:hypothetical protein
MSTYTHSNLSPVLLCKSFVLRGGMAEHNNITEHGNCTDKDFNHHKKAPPASLVAMTVQNRENELRTQLDYHGHLKERVHSGKFMSHVHLTLMSKQNNTPCLLNIYYHFKRIWHGCPNGSILIPKYRFLQELHDKYYEELFADEGCNVVKEMRELIHPKARCTDKYSYANEYRQVFSDTEKWVKEQEEDEEVEHMFEELVEWTSKFCILHPINLNESYKAYSVVDTL